MINSGVVNSEVIHVQYSQLINEYREHAQPLSCPIFIPAIILGDTRNQCHVLARSLGWNEGTEYAMGKSKIFIQDATVVSDCSTGRVCWC